MPREGHDGRPRAPTSELLEGLVSQAAAERITLAQLLDHLGDRSFGIFVLFLAVIALLPGASGLVAILLAVPAIQMMLARRAPVLPRFLGVRQVRMARLESLVRRIAPMLRRLERIVRPRWPTPLESTKRMTGALLLLMGLMLLVPIPFSQFVVAPVIGFVALAYLEQDGVMLALSYAAAAIMMAAMGITVWGTIEGVERIAG